VQSEEFKLIFQMLENLTSKTDEIKDMLHQGDRRMDSIDRDIAEMKAHDQKTDQAVEKVTKEFNEFKEELGFFVVISKNIKKIAGYGAALAILLYFFPSFGKYFK
jgi:methyl-accepting chemotaxis protein